MPLEPGIFLSAYPTDQVEACHRVGKSLPGLVYVHFRMEVLAAMLTEAVIAEWRRERGGNTEVTT
jgi:hypothetical protein